MDYFRTAEAMGGLHLDDIRELKDDFTTELRRKNRSKRTIDGYATHIDYFAAYLVEMSLPTDAPGITRDIIGGTSNTYWLGRIPPRASCFHLSTRAASTAAFSSSSSTYSPIPAAAAREPNRTPVVTAPASESVEILLETIADSTAAPGDKQATGGDTEATADRDTRILALLGHLNLETTRGYVAVLEEDVIRHYQAPCNAVARCDPPRSTARSPTPNGLNSRSISTNTNSSSATVADPTRHPVRTNMPASLNYW